jgi:hypothetical protein
MDNQGRDALMIARGFKSVIWVGAVGSAALACYMVSLQVATERHALEQVQRQIVAAHQDIRSLQTELGTRGRLSQLEHWNAEVLALSSPTSAQFLPNAFTLARLEQRAPSVDEQAADVRMASLPIEAPAPAAVAPIIQAAAKPTAPTSQAALVKTASFSPEAPARPKPAAEPVKAAPKPEKPEPTKVAAKAAKSPEPARLGAKLADDLKAAAAREKDKGSDGH